MWSLPTRGRPQSLQRFVNAYKATNATSKVFVRLDDDDSFLEDYKKIELPDTFILAVGKRQGLKAAMEEMFHTYPNENWYGLGADDLLPQTDQWDKKLAERAGLREISYPNDLGRKTKLPSHPVVGGDLVRAVGWFGHPATHHFFLDNSWKYIGEHLKCIYRMEDVIVEHVHYSGVCNNKAPMDQTYAESKIRLEDDRKLYVTWQEANGTSLIEKLRRQGF